MHSERTAERAARAVYGTIIAMAVLAAFTVEVVGPGTIVAAMVGGVVAAQLAELYAQYLGDVIRRHRVPSLHELRTRAEDSAAGTIAALVPAAPFALAAAGAIDTETAFDIAPWLGLGVLAAYALLANYLAGLSGIRSVVTCASVVAIGLALIALKALAH